MANNDVLNELMKKRQANGGGSNPEPVKPKIDPNEVKKREIEYPEGFRPFSEVFGFEPPSGIDHAVRVFEEDYFPDEVRHLIPQVDDGYSPPAKEVEDFVVGLHMGDNVFMHGPTGSGKSTLPQQVAARMRMPWVRVQGRVDLDSSAVVGTITVEDGTMKWSDGPLTLIWKHGGIYQQDEFSMTPAAMNAVFQRILERNGDLFLEDKPNCTNAERLVPKSKFAWFVATDNTAGQGDMTGQYAGTGIQNSATMDRFGTVIRLNYMDRTKELAMLTKRVDGLENDTAKNMLAFASMVREAFRKDEINVTVSPRVLIEWGIKATYWGNPVKALKSVWFDRLEDEDRALASQFVSKVFNADIAA